MSTPKQALQDALVRLLDKSVGEHGYDPSEFTEATWDFLHALAEVQDGPHLINHYGTYIERTTNEDSEYTKALTYAQKKLRRIPYPKPILVGGTHYRDPLTRLKKTQGQKHDVEEVISDRDAIDQLQKDFSDTAPKLTEPMRQALRQWYDRATEIISYCRNHHVPACQWLLAMSKDKSASWEHGLLGVDLGRFNAVDIQKCAESLVVELESFQGREVPPKTTSTTPKHNIETEPQRSGVMGNIFIGHGHSNVWKDLRHFLTEKLQLECEEFNSVEAAGMTTKERLEEMLSRASFAFLVMTGEEDRGDGKAHARENVVHEIGLFQGKLGFKRAIVLLEDGCEEFSNILGLNQIRFAKGNIMAASERIRDVLAREKIPGQGQSSQPPEKARSDVELSNAEVVYLMTLSRPRNRQGIPLGWFDKFANRNSEEYFEMVKKFCDRGLLRVGEHSYILTGAGYARADSYWKLHILRVVEGLQSSPSEFVETERIAKSAQFFQTDEVNEMQRYLMELSAAKHVEPVTGDSGYAAARMTQAGRAHLRPFIDLDFSRLED